MTACASGDTIYVDNDGGQDYTCIQNAIDNASSGDTVYVYSGTYFENILVDKAIDLVGEDKNTTIIGGGKNHDVIHISADWVNVSDFTIQNAETDWVRRACIYVSESSNNVISNCKIENENKASVGIRIEGSDNKIITNKIISSNHGIYIGGLVDSHNNILQDNIITNNSRGLLIGGNDNHIIKNQISLNTFGLVLEGPDNNILENSIIYNGEFGVSIAAPRNYFYNNTFSNSNKGIEIDGSFYNVNGTIFDSNTVVNNNYFGIEIYDAFNGLTLVKNVLDDGILLHSIDDSQIFDNTVTGNTVNGDPLIYKEGESMMTLDEESAGQIILAKCDNVTANGYDLSDTSCGAILIGCKDCIISNSTFNNNNQLGMSLINSHNNILQDNTFSDIIPDWGEGTAIYLSNSNMNSIKNNQVSNVLTGFELLSSNQNLFLYNNINNFRERGIYGYEYSCGNKIKSNTISGDQNSENTRGIYLYGFSDNNNISYNTISDCWVGVTVGMKTPASNTILFMNTFQNCVFDFKITPPQFKLAR